MVFTPGADDGTPDYMVSNNADVEFLPASANWTEVTYFGVWTAATGGDFLGYGILTNPRTVLIDGVFRFLSGDLDIKMV